MINVTICITLSPLPAARLPFKRLNPEPKENQPPKRRCAHSCPEPVALDGDNENESSAFPVQSGPPLVNGRGPLDCFLSRRHPAPSNQNVIIDLTADNSRSPLKCLVPPAPASPCLQTKDKHQGKDQTASSGNAGHTPDTKTLESSEAEKEDEVEEMEADDGNQTASISQLDSTQDFESEAEEQNESGNVSSHGNKSTLSNSSVNSSSESSPQKTDDPTQASTPTVRSSSCGININVIVFNIVIG